jgi:hypothetical protein
VPSHLETIQTRAQQVRLAEQIEKREQQFEKISKVTAAHDSEREEREKREEALDDLQHSLEDLLAHYRDALMPCTNLDPAHVSFINGVHRAMKHIRDSAQVQALRTALNNYAFLRQGFVATSCKDEHRDLMRRMSVQMAFRVRRAVRGQPLEGLPLFVLQDVTAETMKQGPAKYLETTFVQWQQWREPKKRQ